MGGNPTHASLEYAMRTATISAAAVMLAGLALSAPARAACEGLPTGTCPATISPAANPDTASAKPHKPLNLRKFVKLRTAAKRPAKRSTRVAQRKRPVVAARKRPVVVAAKASRRTIVFARSRRAAAQRLASVRKLPVITFDRPLPVIAAERPNAAAGPDEAIRASAPKAGANTRASSAASLPEPEASTNGLGTRRDEARPQDELTALDLAADAPNADLQIDRTTRSADALTADAPSAGTIDAPPSAPTTPVAAAEPNAAPAPAVAPSPPSPPKDQTETAAPAQQPSDEVSWLRRIAVGLGGLVTLASAVRLFMG